MSMKFGYDQTQATNKDINFHPFPLPFFDPFPNSGGFCGLCAPRLLVDAAATVHAPGAGPFGPVCRESPH